MQGGPYSCPDVPPLQLSFLATSLVTLRAPGQLKKRGYLQQSEMAFQLLFCIQ